MRVEEKPCRYCGHKAARQSDEDCPESVRRLMRRLVLAAAVAAILGATVLALGALRYVERGW